MFHGVHGKNVESSQKVACALPGLIKSITYFITTYQACEQYGGFCRVVTGIDEFVHDAITVYESVPVINLAPVWAIMITAHRLTCFIIRFLERCHLSVRFRSTGHQVVNAQVSRVMAAMVTAKASDGPSATKQRLHGVASRSPFFGVGRTVTKALNPGEDSSVFTDHS